MTAHEDLTIGKILPRLMTFCQKVARDDASPHADEAAGLVTDLLLTAILGLSKVGQTEEGRESIEKALAQADRARNVADTQPFNSGVHDPYNGRS